MHTPFPLRKINDEVYVATDEIVRLGRGEIDFIRDCALKNSRGRARICAHKEAQDSLHEMLIGIRSDSYIRPHRHHNKVESFHLFEGEADIVILTDEGEIFDVIELGLNASLYYRLSTPRYHTLLIRSPVLVIHEITNGPFNSSESDFADFSPPEGGRMVQNFVLGMRERVTEWKRMSVKAL